MSPPAGSTGTNAALGATIAAAARAGGDTGAPGKIAAVILAAGRATRFQATGGAGSKLVALWHGKPLVRHVAEAALAAGLEAVVVTGHAREDVAGALAGLDLNLVHNPDFADGMAGSLRRGLASLAPEMVGAFILLGDMPQISAPLLYTLAQAFAQAPAGTIAAIPVHQGARGNPVLLGRALFEAAKHLSGDRGARQLLAGPGVLEIDMADPAIFADIDTPQALRDLP